MEVIINRKAGSNSDKDLGRSVRDAFAARGAEVRVHLARSGPGVMTLARRAADGPAQIVVAGGGDGTVSTVASMLVGTEKRLGVLPLGTLNHFARDLKLPPSLDDAVQIIIDGHTASIDVGEVNGVIFINNSSLGLYPSIVRKRTDVQRLGYGKWLALLWAVVSVLRRYPLLDVRLSLEGEELTHHTPFVFVGNNKYEIDRFRIGGRARLDSGELSLYLTRQAGRLGLLRLAVRALLGGLRNSDEFYSTGTKELWVETRRKKIRVAKDGEVTVMHTPLHYRVLPGALKVIVPHDDGRPVEQGG